MSEAQRLTAKLDAEGAHIPLQEFAGRAEAIFDAYDDSGTNKELGQRMPSSTGGGSGNCKNIGLYFATFRKADERVTRNAYLRFGSKWADQLTFGTATVSIPLIRQIYSQERDRRHEADHKDHAKIDRSKYFYLQPEMPVCSEQDFFSALKEKVNKRTLMVFVHGFRQTHADALIAAAQLFYDLGFDGAPLALTWPSGFILGSESYFDALEQYKRSNRVLKFVEVIRRAARESGAERIFLIGHSLGCRVLCDLTKRWPLDEKNIADMVLASPDIEVSAFMDAIKPAAAAKKRVFVYASRRDKALQFAQIFGGARAGANPGKIDSNKYDRLEVVTTEGCFYDSPDFWRHSDYSCGAAADLKGALGGEPPKQRRLVPSRTTFGNYWSIG